MCERWKKSSMTDDELSTKDIIDMLRDAKKAGIKYYVVEGGEPLFRMDLPQILHHAKQIGLHTSIVTNGYHLAERCAEIAPVTDSLIVSLDANGELHDKMRGLPGLFQRALEGIRACQRNNIHLSINSVVCTENMGSIHGLIDLARTLSIPIHFQPMDIYKGYNEPLRPPNEQLQKIFQEIRRKKKEGYPIGNSYRYLEHVIRNDGYRCHAPKCYAYVVANGNIVSCCDIVDKLWGNIKETSFHEIFSSNAFGEFTKKMEPCNYCSIYAVHEASDLYSRNPVLLFKKLINAG
jgi:MoaA/NifB/PqqE/SkfB family radical SAM enzyme